MVADEFRSSLQNSQPDPSYSALLQALWWACKGDWEQSHDLVNDCPGADGARLHANLHREEGDLGNANYWYRRAGQKAPDCSWQDEREQLIDDFL